MIFSSLPFSLLPWATTDMLSIITDRFVFSITLYTCNPLYVLFIFVWLLSLSIIILRFIHVVYIRSSEYYSTLWNTTICLSIHLLMDIWVIFTFGAVTNKVLWTFTHKPLSGHVFFFLMSKYPRMECLYRMVGVYIYLFKKLPSCFPKWMYHFTFPSIVFFHIITNTWKRLLNMWNTTSRKKRYPRKLGTYLKRVIMVYSYWTEFEVCWKYGCHYNV